MPTMRKIADEWPARCRGAGALLSMIFARERWGRHALIFGTTASAYELLRS